MKKYKVYLAMIFAILPIYILFSFVTEYFWGEQEIFSIFIWCVSILIGYVFFFCQFSHYTSPQKIMIEVAAILFLISVITIYVEHLLDLNSSDWKTGSMSDLGPYLENKFIFLITYLGQKILCLIAGINILRTTNVKKAEKS